MSNYYIETIKNFRDDILKNMKEDCGSVYSSTGGGPVKETKLQRKPFEKHFGSNKDVNY